MSSNAFSHYENQFSIALDRAETFAATAQTDQTDTKTDTKTDTNHDDPPTTGKPS